MKIASILLSVILSMGTQVALAQGEPSKGPGLESMKGLRLDPGYLYDLGISDATTAATRVVQDAKASGVNTIFMLTYNTVYGANYVTRYADTSMEGTFGRQDLLGKLIATAHANGIKVIAWMPVNNFKKAWMNHADWRSKKKDTVTDYRPDSEAFLLSTHHDGFRNWYSGLLNDLLARYPGLDGLEAAEGMVDYNWNRAADYNPVANQKYKQAYPSGTLGDVNWKVFRAKGLTDLHGTMCYLAHAKGKLCYVVQTWTARNDAMGTLMNSRDIRDGAGFDFDGIMNLQAPWRPDAMIAEIMWQQWRAAYGNPAFTPEWTAAAARDFVAKVGGRVAAYTHIELSQFGNVTPTNQEFEASLRLSLQNSAGVDFYDYYLAKTAGTFPHVKNVFLSAQ